MSDKSELQGAVRKTIEGRAIALPGADIDTDRIIPARFLRCVTFDGLGEHAFADDRQQLAEAGQRHPFDDPARAGARLLVVGRNFGCGSSREHAPQALMRWGDGIAALIGESFAEIFFGNCLALGLPCVTVSEEDARSLAATVEAQADLVLTLDLVAMKLRLPDREISVQMPEGPRKQLLSGRWDSTSELLSGKAEVEKTASALPYFAW